MRSDSASHSSSLASARMQSIRTCAVKSHVQYPVQTLVQNLVEVQNWVHTAAKLWSRQSLPSSSLRLARSTLPSHSLGVPSLQSWGGRPGLETGAVRERLNLGGPPWNSAVAPADGSAGPSQDAITTEDNRAVVCAV